MRVMRFIARWHGERAEVLEVSGPWATVLVDGYTCSDTANVRDLLPVPLAELGVNEAPFSVTRFLSWAESAQTTLFDFTKHTTRMDDDGR